MNQFPVPEGWFTLPLEARAIISRLLSRNAARDAEGAAAVAAVERVQALVDRGDVRTLDDIDEPAVTLDDLRAALRGVE